MDKQTALVLVLLALVYLPLLVVGINPGGGIWKFLTFCLCTLALAGVSFSGIPGVIGPFFVITGVNPLFFLITGVNASFFVIPGFIAWLLAWATAAAARSTTRRTKYEAQTLRELRQQSRLLREQLEQNQLLREQLEQSELQRELREQNQLLREQRPPSAAPVSPVRAPPPKPSPDVGGRPTSPMPVFAASAAGSESDSSVVASTAQTKPPAERVLAPRTDLAETARRFAPHLNTLAIWFGLGVIIVGVTLGLVIVSQSRNSKREKYFAKKTTSSVQRGASKSQSQEAVFAAPAPTSANASKPQHALPSNQNDFPDDLRDYVSRAQHVRRYVRISQQPTTWAERDSKAFVGPMQIYNGTQYDVRSIEVLCIFRSQDPRYSEYVRGKVVPRPRKARRKPICG